MNNIYELQYEIYGKQKEKLGEADQISWNQEGRLGEPGQKEDNGSLGGLTWILRRELDGFLKTRKSKKEYTKTKMEELEQKLCMQPSVPPVTATEAHELECYLNLVENRTCKMFRQSIPHVDLIALK